MQPLEIEEDASPRSPVRELSQSLTLPHAPVLLTQMEQQLAVTRVNSDEAVGKPRISLSTLLPFVWNKQSSKGDPPDVLFRGAVANGCVSILGSGALAQSAAMTYGGMLSYEAVVCGVFVVSYITLFWLIDVADALPEGVPWTYESISKLYLGDRAANLITAIIAISMFALGMMVIIIIKEGLGPLLASACLAPQSLAGPLSSFAVGLFIITPLTCLKDFSRLSCTSAIAVFALGYSMTYVAWNGLRGSIERGVSPTVAVFKLSPGILECAAMTNSAFCMHNQIFPIYKSLGRRRSRKAMSWVIGISMLVATIFYHLFAYGGYLFFGEDSGGANILKVFQETEEHGKDFMLRVANVSIIIMLVCKTPVIVWVVRSAVLSAVRPLYMSAELAHMDPSNLEWNLCSLLLMIAVMACAYIFPNLIAVFSMGAALGGAFIVFAYPSLFHAVVVKRVPLKNLFGGRSAAWPEQLMILIGLFFGVLCEIVAVHNAQKPKPAKAIYDPFTDCPCTSWKKHFVSDC